MELPHLSPLQQLQQLQRVTATVQYARENGNAHDQGSVKSLVVNSAAETVTAGGRLVKDPE